MVVINTLFIPLKIGPKKVIAVPNPGILFAKTLNIDDIPFILLVKPLIPGIILFIEPDTLLNILPTDFETPLIALFAACAIFSETFVCWPVDVAVGDDLVLCCFLFPSSQHSAILLRKVVC